MNEHQNSHSLVSRFSTNLIREIVGNEKDQGGIFMVDVNGFGNRCVFASLGRFVGPYHPLYCVDGCNGFDPFPFVTAARKEGRDPQAVLENIFVSRVFTCHQMTAVVREELPQIVDQPNTPLVAILGISDLFYDEALPFWEREYLYRRTLDHLKILRKKGLITLVTFRDRQEGSGARLWRWLLQHTADRVMRIENQWSVASGQMSVVGGQYVQRRVASGRSDLLWG